MVGSLAESQPRPKRRGVTLGWVFVLTVSSWALVPSDEQPSAQGYHVAVGVECEHTYDRVKSRIEAGKLVVQCVGFGGAKSSIKRAGILPTVDFTDLQSVVYPKTIGADLQFSGESITQGPGLLVNTQADTTVVSLYPRDRTTQPVPGNADVGTAHIVPNISDPRFLIYG